MALKELRNHGGILKTLCDKIYEGGMVGVPHSFDATAESFQEELQQLARAEQADAFLIGHGPTRREGNAIIRNYAVVFYKG